MRGKRAVFGMVAALAVAGAACGKTASIVPPGGSPSPSPSAMTPTGMMSESPTAMMHESPTAMMSESPAPYHS